MSRGVMQRLAGLFAVSAALACAKDPTSIYVSLSIESGVRAVAQGAFIRVFDADDTSPMPVPIAAQIPLEFNREGPYTFLVNHTSTGHPRVRIEVEAYRLPMMAAQGGSRFDGLMPGNGVANDRVIVSWQEDTILKVSMVLRDRCVVASIGMPCPIAQRCDASGRCVPATTNDAAPYPGR